MENFVKMMIVCTIIYKIVSQENLFVNKFRSSNSIYHKKISIYYQEKTKIKLNKIQNKKIVMHFVLFAVKIRVKN